MRLLSEPVIAGIFSYAFSAVASRQFFSKEGLIVAAEVFGAVLVGGAITGWFQASNLFQTVSQNLLSETLSGLVFLGERYFFGHSEESKLMNLGYGFIFALLAKNFASPLVGFLDKPMMGGNPMEFPVSNILYPSSQPPMYLANNPPVGAVF